ncbi:MAG TPA: hypothetical protein VHG93_27070, partial [Longimicrobium sp.]|nr:hypothetical protein [Longimicrobium sp.]
ARGEALLGSRGYRRTVLDAGRVAAGLEAAAGQAAVPVHAAYEFHDREVDRLLEIDGTELGTLALFTVGGGDDAHWQG